MEGKITLYQIVSEYIASVKNVYKISESDAYDEFCEALDNPKVLNAISTAIADQQQEKKKQKSAHEEWMETFLMVAVNNKRKEVQA